MRLYGHFSVVQETRGHLLEGTTDLSRHAHFKGISIYVFPEKELSALSPNFHIHVSIDLYILTIGPPIFLQQNTVDRPIVGKYKSLTET
jgi:hypothetical protein